MTAERVTAAPGRYVTCQPGAQIHVDHKRGWADVVAQSRQAMAAHEAITIEP